MTDCGKVRVGVSCKKCEKGEVGIQSTKLNAQLLYA